MYVFKYVMNICPRLPGLWYSLGIPVSSTDKTDHLNITEILLKVALNTINSLYKLYLDKNIKL